MHVFTGTLERSQQLVGARTGRGVSMSKLWRIGGIVVGIAAVVGFIITQLNVSEYNDYIEKVRPHLAAQDALVAEM